jgi:hypothetical protein
MTMGNRSRFNGHGEYKRGYRKGLLDSLHALAADFTDVEYVVDDDGTERSAQCYRCLLVKHGYNELADLFERTIGERHP